MNKIQQQRIGTSSHIHKHIKQNLETHMKNVTGHPLPAPYIMFSNLKEDMAQVIKNKVL